MGYHERMGKSDEWYTPKYVFDALNTEFDVDVAAPKDRYHVCVPAKSHITENSLDIQWNGFAWMNPPFGGRNGLEPWLNKMISHGNGIALVPDRTSAPWFQSAVKKADAVLFVAGKIKFIRPDGSKGKHPGNGTCFMAFGPKAVHALKNAQQNGLGVYFEQ